MIDLNETGRCSVQSCRRTGLRARGARDIEPLASRVGGVIHKSFYCKGCLGWSAQSAFREGVVEAAKRKLPKP